jgi:hypothetical protein
MFKERSNLCHSSLFYENGRWQKYKVQKYQLRVPYYQIILLLVIKMFKTSFWLPLMNHKSTLTFRSRLRSNWRCNYFVFNIDSSKIASCYFWIAFPYSQLLSWIILSFLTENRFHRCKIRCMMRRGL